jgi:hypothetical protein
MYCSVDRNQHEYWVVTGLIVQAMAAWLDHCECTDGDDSYDDAVNNEDKQHIDTNILLLDLLDILDSSSACVIRRISLRDNWLRRSKELTRHHL